MKNKKTNKKEDPEIYAVKKKENGAKLSRQEFLKTAAGIGGLLTASSCASLYKSTNRYANKMEVRQMKETKKTFTIPCDSPIPAGATCICNCVAASRTYPGTEMICTCDTISVAAGTQLTNYSTCVCNTVKTCTCNTVCTCDTVCSCNNHRTTYTYYTTYWHPN